MPPQNNNAIEPGMTIAPAIQQGGGDPIEQGMTIAGHSPQDIQRENAMQLGTARARMLQGFQAPGAQNMQQTNSLPESGAAYTLSGMSNPHATAIGAELADLPGGMLKSFGTGGLYPAWQGFQQAKQDLQQYGVFGPPQEVRAERVGQALGINSSAVAEAARNKDYAGILTESVLPIAMTLMGGKIFKGESPPESGPLQGYDRTAYNRQLATDSVRTRVVQKLEAAVKPAPGAAEALRDSGHNSIPELKQLALSNSPPKTLGELGDGLEKFGQQYEHIYQTIKEPHVNDIKPVNNIVAAYDRLLNGTTGDAFKLRDPEGYEAMKAQRDRWADHGEITIGLADELREQMHAQNEALVNKISQESNITRSAAMDLPDVKGKIDLENSLKNMVYDHLNEFNQGIDVRRLKQSQADMMSLREGMYNRVNSLGTKEATQTAMSRMRRVATGAVTGAAPAAVYGAVRGAPLEAGLTGAAIGGGGALIRELIDAHTSDVALANAHVKGMMDLLKGDDGTLLPSARRFAQGVQQGPQLPSPTDKARMEAANQPPQFGGNQDIPPQRSQNVTSPGGAKTRMLSNVTASPQANPRPAPQTGPIESFKRPQVYENTPAAQERMSGRPSSPAVSQAVGAQVETKTLFDTGNRAAVSVKVGGKYAGRLSITPSTAGKGAWEISTSGIDEEFQGKGLGKEGYRAAIDLARKKGATEVWSDNRATSPQARHVWDALGKEYPVERVGTRYRIKF